MPLYEHIFLARPDLSGQQVDQLIEHFKGVIAENGGSVGRTENWGLKTLAYRMDKSRKAHYALMDITAPAAAVAEMERQMRIHDDVMRYLTVKVEAHEDGPSVMRQKRDRDDRRRGRGRDDDDRGERGERFGRDRGERGDRERGERFGDRGGGGERVGGGGGGGGGGGDRFGDRGGGGGERFGDRGGGGGGGDRFGDRDRRF